LIGHVCPIIQGDSGGPILYRVGDDVYLMGIHVGIHRALNARTALGQLVPSASFSEALSRFHAPGSQLPGTPPLFGRKGSRPTSSRGPTR
jgi:hypothetical protein